MNLLIVDDDVIAIKAMMSGIDWNACGVDGSVYTAYNSVQALDVFDRSDVDVVLCDIEMPGDSGIELIRRIRDAKRETACIFLTCHANFSYAQDALRLGCKDYILKPAPYETIAASLRKIINELAAIRQDREIQHYGSQWLRRQIKNAENVQKDHRSVDQIVEDVSAYILGRLDSRELSVGSIAKIQYLNEDYLNRIFKRKKNVSINQFIINERMKLAAQLLKTPALSINAVAIQVGYTNYPYFIATFKKIHGCSPSLYREAQSNSSDV